MGLPALIAGLIIRLAGSTWFTGANTVGDILIIVGAVALMIQVLIVLIAASSK